MSGPYNTGWPDWNRMPPEPGDLVISGYVIRSGVDLMNVAMDTAAKSEHLRGERDALASQVKEANAATAEQQVKTAQAEAEIRRLKERLQRVVEERDQLAELTTQKKKASA